MTVVPWGSIEGNIVEEFVAALLLLRFPKGTHVTPSRGDQGVDIKVPTEGGYDIYQVKKFSSALTSGQATKVEKSWRSVNDEFGAENTITGWYLVMPWNPSREREKWFKKLTAKADFPCEWMGRSHLNGWAADNPRLVEYFFGQGQAQLQQMIANLTINPIGKQGDSGDSRIEAIANRYRQLQEVLDDISPFYRYRLALVRAADLAEILDHGGPSDAVRSAVTTYRRISPDHYIEVSISPVSEEAAIYDPISLRLAISANESNADELEHFYEYGVAPTEPIPAEVVEAQGPPGSIPQLASSGSVRFADVVVPSPWESLALCSFVSETAQDNEEMLIVELGPLVTTEGRKGRAIRAEGQALGMQLLIKPNGGTMSLNTWGVPIRGKLPHKVYPELLFAQRLWSGKHATALSVPNGPALVNAKRPPARPDEADEARGWAEIAFALTVLQRLSIKQLKMPYKLSAKESHTIRSAAQLVIDGTAECEWEDFQIVSPVVPLDGTVAILAFQPLKIAYDDQTFELDASIRQECDMVEAVEVTKERIIVRPKNNAKLRQRLVARSENDYRVLSKPVNSAEGRSRELPEVEPTRHTREGLARLTVSQLKSLARAAGISGYSRLRKMDLLDVLTMEDGPG